MLLKKLTIIKCMKKVLLGAIALVLTGCYTPMNNSGVATTKPWLEVPGKRVDFDGKQYDSCVRFDLRFWPQEAAERLDLQKTCITACCWRSEQSEIVLDFNRKFDEEMEKYGHARRYSPDKITLKVTHSNLVNVTRVKASPAGAIKNNGLVKLSYKEVRDEERIEALERARQYRAQQSYQPEYVEPSFSASVQTPVVTRQVSTVVQTTKSAAPAKPAAPKQTGETLAKALVQRQVGAQIDTYFYQMNKTYRQQSAVFILSSRLLTARAQQDGSYLVTCHAKARTGIDEKHLNTSDFPCGVWLVDIGAQMVLPYDAKAKQIKQ